MLYRGMCSMRNAQLIILWVGARRTRTKVFESQDSLREKCTTRERLHSFVWHPKSDEDWLSWWVHNVATKTKSAKRAQGRYQNRTTLIDTNDCLWLAATVARRACNKTVEAQQEGRDRVAHEVRNTRVQLCLASKTCCSLETYVGARGYDQKPRAKEMCTRSWEHIVRTHNHVWHQYKVVGPKYKKSQLRLASKHGVGWPQLCGLGLQKKRKKMCKAGDPRREKCATLFGIKIWWGWDARSEHMGSFLPFKRSWESAAIAAARRWVKRHKNSKIWVRSLDPSMMWKFLLCLVSKICWVLPSIDVLRVWNKNKEVQQGMRSPRGTKREIRCCFWYPKFVESWPRLIQLQVATKVQLCTKYATLFRIQNRWEMAAVAAARLPQRLPYSKTYARSSDARSKKSYFALHPKCVAGLSWCC